MWFKQSQSPSIMVGSYINVGDGLLTVYIDGKRYEFYMNPSQKHKFESLLKYNRGRALAYLRKMERSS